MTNIALDANLSDISREDFQAFFNDFLGDKNIKEQSVVHGRVIGIVDDWVTVDVGYKAEGRIRLDEFPKTEDGATTISVGDQVEVWLESMDEEMGELRLSKEKADLMKAWDEVARAAEADETVSGYIVARVLALGPEPASRDPNQRIEPLHRNHQR